jgi:hypothetical protein
VEKEIVMNMLSKTALLATVGAVLMTAVPAQARGGNWGRDKIDAGDVIAGALIIGGIAAIASAASNNDGYRGGRYDNGGYDNDRGYRGRGHNGGYGGYNSGYGDDYGAYDRGNGSRWAVEQCVRAAKRQASRYGWARVTDVTSINRVRGGYEVRGRIVVEDRGGRGGYNSYDRGYQYDRYNDGYDKGRFSCITNYNRVADIRLGGLQRGY